MKTGPFYPLLAMLLVAVWSAPVAAHVFTDGTSANCVVRGVTLREYEAPSTDPLVRDRAGITTPEGSSYAIVWNSARLKTLPPVMRDFLFFHECAHAKIPTSSEVTANCGGLRDMRAAGRAGPAVEAQLELFFGNNNYWQETVRCANKVIEPTPSGPLRLTPSPSVAPKSPG